MTKQVDVYTIDELQGSAVETAMYHLQEFFDYDNSDNMKTLDSFCEIFNIKVTNWSFDEWNYNYTLQLLEYDTEDLHGIELVEYIQDSINISVINDYEKCPLTGYYIDHDILQPVAEYLKNPNTNISYYELMNQCLNAFYKACQEDYKGYYGEDNMIEMATINEVYFTESGNLYH